MEKDFKLFVGCVESMLAAEKECEKNPTPRNKKIHLNLRNKVEGWIQWVHNKEEGNTSSPLPPFIGKIKNSKGGNKPRNLPISEELYRQLRGTHTPEEISECFGS
ncbi:MAG: hypothetical protein IKQ32_00225 [Prevotella sp.]|nr:hypothetical protein [Prevotella sp.]